MGTYTISYSVDDTSDISDALKDNLRDTHTVTLNLPALSLEPGKTYEFTATLEEDEKEG